MKQMHPYRLPLKFILLWIVNIALLLLISFSTGLYTRMMQMRIQNMAYLYLGLGAVLALLEQELWDRLKKNRTPKE